MGVGWGRTGPWQVAPACVSALSPPSQECPCVLTAWWLQGLGAAMKVPGFDRKDKTRNLVAAGFWILSVTFYVLGLCYPLMSTKYQVLNIPLKHQDVTLFDSVRMFWGDSEYLIASIILVFTFILPVLKYIELSLTLTTGRQFLKLRSVDKWNMIDVFLVAMLLLNFKMNSRFIVMRLEWGTNFIALAVLTRLVTILLVEGFGRKSPKENTNDKTIEPC